jgi:O-acetyl-ADP-ribose deacetylase (regulator of RNase III)
MITYKTGNLLDASAEALVNAVNTVSVMGKGIAHRRGVIHYKIPLNGFH